MDEIKNCIITGGTTTILRYYVDNDRDPLYKLYKGYHSGIDLACKSAYNYFPGQVIYVGNEDGQFCVTVRYNISNCFNYKEMESVYVETGQYVDIGTKLGDCKDHVHVEYINLVQSIWTMRVCGIDYYKHDPLGIILSGYSSFDSYVEEHVDLNYFDPMNSNLTASVVNEFTGNKGS